MPHKGTWSTFSKATTGVTELFPSRPFREGRVSQSWKQLLSIPNSSSVSLNAVSIRFVSNLGSNFPPG